MSGLMPVPPNTPLEHSFLENNYSFSSSPVKRKIDVLTSTNTWGARQPPNTPEAYFSSENTVPLSSSPPKRKFDMLTEVDAPSSAKVEETGKRLKNEAWNDFDMDDMDI